MNEPADPRLHVEELTWNEVADLVWLAAAITESTARPESSAPAPRQDAERPPPPSLSEPAPPPPATVLPAPSPVAPGLEPLSGDRATGGGMGSELHVSAIARALRPLARRVPSHTETVLDEEGMAVRAAETGMWLPVQRPAPTQLLEAMLVVDTSKSMGLWRATAAELQRLLERQGAFRDVRRVDVDTDQEFVRSYLTQGLGEERPLDQLVAPAGRRVIFVLTDGVGAAWRPAALGGWLGRLGEAGPLVVLNVLPHRLWHHGRFTTEQVRLGAATPAVANRRLSWHPVSPADVPVDTAMPVPVLELDGRWLSRWTSLVAATGPVVVELPALLVGAATDTVDTVEPVAADLPAADLVRRFHLTASPTAFRLAALFAAVPVTRSVMRVVALSMVPDSTLPHVAEVLLSGLLDEADEEGEYRFRPGVREELLSALRRTDTVRAVRTTAERLAAELPALAELRAAIADPGAAELPEQGSALALQAAVLRALSGPYLARADRLRNVAAASAENSRTTFLGEGADTIMPEAPVAQAPPVWGGVPVRNRNFVDRDELAAVRSAFGGDGPVVLRGEAGAGKTELAAEYVYRSVSDHRVVWWFAAHEPAGVVAGYRQLALRLGLTGVGAGGQAAVAAVHADLATRSDWLLVFDGAADPATLEPYLPVGGGVVVTTRDPAWREHGTTVEVGRFTRAQSLELLRRMGSEVDESVADALGNLPSAVSHAGAWLAGGMPPAEYRELLRTGGPCAPAVDAMSDAARVMLNLCAAFGGWPVPRSLLFGRADLPPAATEVLEDPVRAHAVLRELTRAGLVVRDFRANTVSVPELARVEVLARQEPEAQAKWSHAAHLLLAAAPVSVDLVAPLRGAAECEEQGVRDSLLAVVAHLVEQGDPHNASAIADEVGGAWVAAFGTGHPDTVAMSMRWGVARRLLGDCKDAVRVHRAHGPQLVRSLMVSGAVDTAVGLARALHARGPDGAATLAAALRLAAVLHGTKVPPAALTLQTEVMDRLQNERGDRDPATLFAMVDVAVTADLLGEPGADASIALPLLGVEVGTAHPFTIACATAAAGELAAKGEHEQAVTLGEETAHTAAAAWGEEHPLTLAARLNLALDLSSVGRSTAAEEVREAAFAACHRALGAGHPLSRLATADVRVWHDLDPAPGWTDRER